MLPAEHILESRRLMTRAQDEFAAGDMPVSCELLWGAVAHATIAVAMARQWPADSHGAFKAAIMRISRERREDYWHSDFDSAENLHKYFYHRHLPADELAHRRRRAEMLLFRLLGLLNE